MKTGVISIGNSDDKLTQVKWSAFINDVSWIISRYSFHQHFNGFASPSAPWQNACWIIEIDDDGQLDQLRYELRRIAAKFHQDSIALLVGDTEFVSGK